MLTNYKNYLEKRTYSTFEKSYSYSNSIISKANKLLDEYFDKTKLDKSKVCFVAVGSIGRYEALKASDLDIIPVIINDRYLRIYKKHDKRIRRFLSSRLKVKVSAGSDLTSTISINKLTDLKGIGGEVDTNSLLTKRILILTEGTYVFGNFKYEIVMKEILDSYSKNETTRGKHILTLCNDIARYYRTLCIEYKAKIDVTNKDWGTRNAKLRHSRKVWYFSTLIAMINSSKLNYYNISDFKKQLLKLFCMPPVLRLFESVDEQNYLVLSKLLNYYSWFLEFMAIRSNRKKLALIKYSNRYEDVNGNYYKIKMNSDMVHRYICYLIQDMQPSQKQKIIDWFLL